MSRRWIVVAFIFAGILISYIDRGNLGIAAPSIMREFNFTPSSMGMLLSAFFWTYAVFQIPAGAIIDRIGIRVVYACAFLLWSLASSAIGLSNGLATILLLRMLLGMAESIGPIASMSFIRRNFSGAEAGLPIGIYIAGQNLGPAAGTLIGTQLIQHLGWRAMFVITGLGALLWIPGWLWFAPRDDARVMGAPAATATASGGRDWPESLLGYVVVQLSFVLFLVFPIDVGAHLSHFVAWFLDHRNGAGAIDSAVRYGCPEHRGWVRGGSFGAPVGLDISGPPLVLRSRVPDVRRSAAAACAPREGGGAPSIARRGLRNGSRQCKLLGDIATRSAVASDRAGDRVSQYDLADRGRGGAADYGLDTRS